MKVTHCPERKRPSKWRLYHRGRSSYYPTEEAARKAADEIAESTSMIRGRLSAAQIDEVIHCRELLKGTPLLRAVRFYLEAHRAQTEAMQEPAAVMIAKFTNTLRGRPKYLAEATRNLGLLSKSLGPKIAVGEISTNDIEEFLNCFDSEWSHDAALKFARAFFKWACSARVRARTDNPTDLFEFKNPQGSKIYLTIADATHMLGVCRTDFPDILPAIALQAFAGIRTEEIIRGDWRTIRRGSIRLDPEVAKMGQVKGKRVPRIIDFWPAALDAWMPSPLPTSGPIAADFRRRKGELIAACRESKKDFRWGQNALRHSYGTYAYAFFQSADRVAKLMGERDVDTLINHYAEYETEENGQAYLSIGSSRLEAPPMPKNIMNLIQQIHRATSSQPAAEAASA